METTFDSLGYFDKLKQAGVPEAQAKVQAEALKDVLDTSQHYLATKRDLEATKQELQRDIKELEYRLMLKLGGIAVATAGICTAIILGLLPMLLPTT